MVNDKVVAKIKEISGFSEKFIECLANANIKLGLARSKDEAYFIILSNVWRS